MDEPADTTLRVWPQYITRPALHVLVRSEDPSSATMVRVGQATSGNYRAILIDESDPYDYGRKIARLWPQHQALILIGAGILPSQALIEGFAECPEPWCTAYYPTPGRPYTHGLECVKFSAQLQQRRPLLALQATRLTPQGADYALPAEAMDDAYDRIMVVHNVARHDHGRVARVPDDQG